MQTLRDRIREIPPIRQARREGDNRDGLRPGRLGERSYVSRGLAARLVGIRPDDDLATAKRASVCFPGRL
jgi:hypothetical protein